MMFAEFSIQYDVTTVAPKHSKTGYAVRVTKRNRIAVEWDSEKKHGAAGVFETEIYAQQAGHAWIQAQYDQARRVAELRRERKDALPAKLQESWKIEAELSAQVRELNKAKKAQTTRQHALTTEAESPSVEVEFVPSLRTFRVYDSPSESAGDLKGDDPRQQWLPGTRDDDDGDGEPQINRDHDEALDAAKARGRRRDGDGDGDENAVEAADRIAGEIDRAATKAAAKTPGKKKGAKKAAKKTTKKKAGAKKKTTKKKAGAKAGGGGKSGGKSTNATVAPFMDPKRVRWPGDPEGGAA